MLYKSITSDSGTKIYQKQKRNILNSKGHSEGKLGFQNIGTALRNKMYVTGKQSSHRSRNNRRMMPS